MGSVDSPTKLFGYFGLLTTNVIFTFQRPFVFFFEGKNLDLI